MSLVLASCFLVFLNKEEGKKLLAIALIVYLLILSFVKWNMVLTLEDFIGFYSVLTLALCILVVGLTEFEVKHKIAAIIVVLPQVFYLYILHKPYYMSPEIPMWFVLNADSIFLYSVFCLSYEQCTKLNFNELCFKDYMLNMAILMSLVLF